MVHSWKVRLAVAIALLAVGACGQNGGLDGGGPCSSCSGNTLREMSA